MFFYEGYICPVCEEKFKDTDDIVGCPDCGAPHHRSCWQDKGGCHFSSSHGTHQQWRRPEQSEASPPTAENKQSANADAESKQCPRCGQTNMKYSEFCSKCGAPLPYSDWSSQRGGAVPPPAHPFGGYGEYSPIHAPAVNPYGGLPKEEKIEDVTVEEFAAFVAPNSSHYIPKFHRMSHTGSCISWNWAAFLITPFWLFYRKMYIAGGIAFLLNSVLTFFFNYISDKYLASFFSAKTADDMINVMADNKLGLYLIMTMLLALAMLLINIIFGLVGNYIYFRTSLKKINQIKKERTLTDSGYIRDLNISGGISMPSVSILLAVNILLQMAVNISLR